MGFNLKSGNGPLAFKNMGSSSPAKGWDDILSAGKKANIEKPDSNATVKSVTDKATVGVVKPPKKDAVALEKKTAANKLAADKAAKASRGWEEKKEANKAEKKENRGTRKDFRKGNKEEIAELRESGADRKTVRAAKKENRKEQKDLKQSHRDDSKANKEDYKSGDDYKAHKAEQKQKFSDAVGELSDRLDPDNRGLYARSKQAKEGRADKNIQNEKDRVNTARTQQLIDATNKAGTEEEKLSSTPPIATTENGNAAIDATSESSAEKTARKKTEVTKKNAKKYSTGNTSYTTAAEMLEKSRIK
jgi:hypothetical protein